MTAPAELLEAMRARGLTPPDGLVPGKYARFPSNGRRTDRAGWCWLYPDLNGAVFGDNRAGWREKWQAKRAAPLSEAEREQTRRLFEAAKAKAEQERQAEQQRAAERARELWNSARPADPGHPYLVAKGMQPGSLRQHGKALLVPVLSESGELQALQFIQPTGEKRFLQGGKVQGGRFWLREPSDGGRILLCEGVATGAALARALHVGVCVCFSAGNLAAVARTLPRGRVTICGDDDRSTEGNAGRTKAEAAAKETGAGVAFPPFAPGDPGTDWDDYIRLHGIEPARQTLQARAKLKPPLFSPIGELLAHPKPIDWVVKGWLERNTTAALIAEPGRGKSFMALDLACCVARGIPWHGCKTKQASVLYLCGEGRAAMIRRACAWSTVYGDLSRTPLYLSAGAVTINDADALTTLQAEIDALPSPPGLIIIDTLQRSLVGDENSAEAMGGFVRALDTLRERYGCTCLVVHHPSKTVPGEPRGHGSLKGAIDAMAILEPREEGVIVAINPKQRTGDNARPLAFKFRTVELPPAWNDEDGEPTTSAILETSDLPASTPKAEKGLGDKQRLALAVLKRLIAEHQRNLAEAGRDISAAKVEMSEWRKVACNESDINPRNFSRLARALEDRGTIAIEGGFVCLAASSASSASNAANEAGVSSASYASNAFKHDADDACPEDEANYEDF
ncbi:AAA family ATPase [Acidithiobacillus montserratensis]|uniref:AAA family ATPase n=1 Tax=Acidithiobacillus montserratensis TaxID=2729135 RepID=A0ACD5HFT4_9PROT